MTPLRDLLALYIIRERERTRGREFRMGTRRQGLQMDRLHWHREPRHSLS